MKRTSIFAAALGLMIGASALQQPAQAGWTIYERQVRLKKEVAQGMKANELTKKEYDGLNESLNDINERIKKMKNHVYRSHLARAVALRGTDGEVIKWFATWTEIEGQR